MKLPSAVASKSYLRDCVRRLGGIRKRCGKEDEEKEPISSGDPFRDKTQAFMKDIAAAKEMIADRNAGVRMIGGSDRDAIEQSHEVNKLVRGLELDLQQIKAMVDQSDRELARAQRKKKAQTKIMLLEQQFKGRQSAHDMCLEVLNSVRTMNDQRFNNGLLALPTKKGKKEQLTPEQVLGKKMLMRQQLLDITRGRAEDANAGAAAAGAEGPRLETHPETAEQMKIIKDQERRINAGLDRLAKGVARLHELAVQIGSEIDVQNRMLDETEEKVNEQTKNLKQLNKQLKGLIKKSKPLNVFLNIFCFCVLLGLIGYFLYMFNVV